MHTHSPTCVKYALSRGHGNCRFGAPWPLIERTTFQSDKGVVLHRNHPLVNKYNPAMAVGLRHNHDVSFIGTKAKSLALVFYLTNYATKVEDPAWKRLALAKEVMPAPGQSAETYLTRVANRVFTERALSQVEVVAHHMGQKMDYGSQEAWTFVNIHVAYRHVYRRWQHLQREAGDDELDENEDRILVAETGQKTSLLDAYPHRGPLLADMCLYDYMATVTLVKRRNRAGGWGMIDLDSSWERASSLMQQLRRPGHLATVCIDGMMSMDFTVEEETTHRAAAVQHLGLFVPWERFLSERNDDINDIWEQQLAALPRRVRRLVGNVQLLRRSAEDAKRDREQWAAQSSPPQWMEDEDRDAAIDENEQGGVYRADDAATATRLLDVFRRAVGHDQVTHGSREIRSVIDKVGRFEQAATLDLDDLLVHEPATRSVRIPGSLPDGETPSADKLKAIKRQQARLSRERERAIQGIQGAVSTGTSYDAAVSQVMNGFGEDDVEIHSSDTERRLNVAEPSSRLELGPSTSFSEAGRKIAERLTLNDRQGIAFRLIYRQMDCLRQDEAGTTQLCMFLGGEGGTGKSRVVQAIADLFTLKGMSNRLLVTATSGAAAAQINGVTIHAACQLKVGGNSGQSRPQPPVSGEIQAVWQEKWLLIVDEVSMLGTQTLYEVNEALRRFRGQPQDFGGIPIVLMCGDFHQFRPVLDKSLLSRGSVKEWDNDRGSPEARYKSVAAWRLWERFATVVLLKEQVRAAGDPVLRGLLSRIRNGQQDMNDLNLLNQSCYRPGQRISWAPDLTVVTPLNRNRWNLNIEATIASQQQQGCQMRIFLSEHHWVNGNPTEAEAIEMLSRGDDSDSAVPGIFMFVPGMPVAVNINTHQGLKLVNGAHYTAVDVIVDPKFPAYRLDANTLLHLGPPAGLLLTGPTTQDLHFVDMPPKTILLLPMTASIQRVNRRPWQTADVKRRGLPCTPAFACTDYKVQGRTLSRAAVELRGTRMIRSAGETTASPCDPYSLYVQLSRCRTLADLTLVSEVRPEDFLNNPVPEEMLRGEERLERLSEATIAAAREER